MVRINLACLTEIMFGRLRAPLIQRDVQFNSSAMTCAFRGDLLT